MDAVDLPPRLHIDGSTLLKPNGQPWIGRGVSFGHFWLDTPQDVAAVQALGANCVRILLRWWAPPRKGEYQSQDSRDDNAYAFIHRDHFRNWLDLIVTASAAGLWVVAAIDSNCGQSGTQDPATVAFCDPYGVFGARGRNFWTDAPMKRLYASVWQSAAAALRMIPRIAMLEIQPEPLDGRGAEAAGPVRDFYAYLADAIREVDQDTPFLVGARDGYNIKLCAEALDTRRSDFIYTGNLLSGWVNNPPKFAEGLATLVALRDAHSVPIWIQQLGRKTGDDPQCVNMRGALQACKDAGVGFAWWAWKQSQPSPDDYSLNYPTSDSGGWVAKTNEQTLLTEYL